MKDMRVAEMPPARVYIKTYRFSSLFFSPENNKRKKKISLVILFQIRQRIWKIARRSFWMLFFWRINLFRAVSRVCRSEQRTQESKRNKCTYTISIDESSIEKKKQTKSSINVYKNVVKWKSWGPEREDVAQTIIIVHRQRNNYNRKYNDRVNRYVDKWKLKVIILIIRSRRAYCTLYKKKKKKTRMINKINNMGKLCS